MLGLLEGQLSRMFSFFTDIELRKVLVEPCPDPACGLQPLSAFGMGIDRWATEKSHSITPPAVLISHLCLRNDAVAAVSLKLN